MTTVEGGLKYRGHLDRLVQLLVLVVLAGIWAISIAYAVAERGRILERAQDQLGATVSTLADLNELADIASAKSLETGNEQRTAAIWRALLQYPTSSIWFETDGVVTAGEEPGGDLASFIMVHETRPSFTVNAALPRADVLTEWRRSQWRQGSILAAITIGVLLLAKSLAGALRRRTIAEREAAAAQEREAQLSRYRVQLEETVEERTGELNEANEHLQTELVERKVAQEALREHDALLKAVTKSATELLGSHRFEDSIPVVLALIGETVAVGRVQISAIEPDGDGHLRSHLRHEWSATGLSSLAGDAALREFDISAHLPKLIAPLLAGGIATFFIDDVGEAYRELFEKAGMRSFLQIPLQIGGKLWGSFNFIDSGEVRRQWSWAETDTLETLAGIIGVAMVRARYVKELADANMIVQNSPTILYRLRGEPSLPMIYVSHNITKFGHDPAELLNAANWSQRLIHPDDQAKVGAAMARVLEKNAQAASIEFRLATGDGSYRWVDNRYTPVRDKAGRLIEVEGIIIDITERKLAEEKIALLARTDSLTGLANRATFNERLEQAFAATGRGATPFSVLFLDLDHFKSVNDTLGHPGGDLLLREMAARLKAATRETDLVARLGGDEFAVLQADMTELASAGSLAAKIQEALTRPYMISGNERNETVSIGISPFIPGTASPEAMMSQADLALYRAKEEGRNCYRFHSKELDQQLQVRIALADDLRKAIDRSQFVLYYQPQVELRSGKIIGVEALIRWNHPTRGLLAPSEFLPVAERTGIIVMLGRWVLDEACRQMKSWQDAGVAPPIVAINLSLQELKSSHELVATVSGILAKWGLVPAQLEFGVTEGTLARVTWLHNDVLADLHRLGVGVAIDDFGTEYSSFEYLRAYRVNHIKIAQSFIRSGVHDPERGATIRAIVSLAREFGIEVIAEGVETREQRDLLVAAGSTDAQGFYFSKPVDADSAYELLRDIKIRPPAKSVDTPPTADSALADAAAD
jgi:diguanylate cyclase (GGDEF)-like protein/PAS domain S-box-containing protein